ncbi:MAG: DNA polymerase/3'-5' exonuclease PolX [archaeon]
MLNFEIAKIFYDFADVLEVLGVDWKPQAYRKVARTLESLKDAVEDIYDEKGIEAIEELPGIGEGTAKKIVEFIKTGKISAYDREKKKLPPNFAEMLEIQSLGPKKAKFLYEKLKIKSVANLEKAIKEHKIAKLPGFGVKSEENILAGIEMHKRRKARMFLGEAYPLAQYLVHELKKLKEIKNAVAGGSVRRMKETIGDIDILVVPKDGKPATISKIMNYFTKLPEIDHVLAKGNTKSSVVLKNGVQSDVRVIPEKSFGAALQYFTGNIDHNVKLRGIAIKKGLKLSEYGVFDRKTNRFVAGRTEEAVYKKLGLKLMPPELREDTGEIEAAQTGKLPKLVELKDIKGDLHIHTDWSDGADSIDEMIDAARKLGYEYVAFTDHSKSDTIARGMNEKKLEKYILAVRNAASKHEDIKVLVGAEVYIHADGSLDYSDSILKKLDVVIASIHRNFKMPRELMTKRILKALGNKYVSIFAHPTARQINIRNPIDFDKKEVFRFCAKKGIVLEVNASPLRLDLNYTDVKEATGLGCKIIINTDAHSAAQLRFMNFGVATARRGWAEAGDVVNTYSLKNMQKQLSA